MKRINQAPTQLIFDSPIRYVLGITFRISETMS
jgi:hypothetical protein